MKIISVVILFIVIFTIETYSQNKKYSLTFYSTIIVVDPPPKDIDINHKMMFEFGLLFNISGKGLYSTYAGTYDFNLISRKLYGSLQLGMALRHSEDKGAAFVLFGSGLDYNVFVKGAYNLSTFVGIQGIWAPMHIEGWWTVHLRNNILLEDNMVLTIGLKYLPRMGSGEHWLMPTLGYQLLLK